jgi:putative transcriptional regulator
MRTSRVFACAGEKSKSHMSEERITRVKLDASNKRAGKTDWARLKSMSDAEVHAAALADSDNPPLTEQELDHLEPPPQVKAIREELGMTQREFASAYHLSLATVRDWEQGRYLPGQAARTLLKLIARKPLLVEQALQ